MAIVRNEHANVTVTHAFISALLTCQCYTNVAILDKGHKGPSHGCQQNRENHPVRCQCHEQKNDWMNKWVRVCMCKQWLHFPSVYQPNCTDHFTQYLTLTLTETRFGFQFVGISRQPWMLQTWCHSLHLIDCICVCNSFCQTLHELWGLNVGIYYSSPSITQKYFSQCLWVEISI